MGFLMRKLKLLEIKNFKYEALLILFFTLFVVLKRQLCRKAKAETLNILLHLRKTTKRADAFGDRRE